MRLPTKVSALAFVLICCQAAANDWQLDNSSARKTALKTQLNAVNSEISTTDRATKYSKMDDSPFIFYRGTAQLYYADLAAQHILNNSNYYSDSAVTWIQGDMHVQNFGAFDDDEGDVVFDVNDFDEAWVASYLFDIYRASASLILVAQEQGFNSNSEQKQIVDAFVESYLDEVDDYRNTQAEKNTEVTKSNAYGRLDEFLSDVEQSNSREEMLNKWSVDTGSVRQFDLSNNKLAPVTASERTAVTAAINAYHNTLSSGLNGNSDYFQVLDVARRINAGTGSLGTTRFYALIEGASGSDNNDRILDVKKQALPSVYPYLSSSLQQNLINRFSATLQGCRVAEAQKAMLTDVDDHLGCAVINGDSFSVRERSPFKESFDTTELTSMTRFTKLAEQWGWILATAHSRADNDHNNDFVAYQFEEALHDIADGHHAELRSEVFDFAQSYAAQVKVDYQFFLQLLNEGQLN